MDTIDGREPRILADGPVDGPHPVVSTRYDPLLMKLLRQKTGLKNAQILRLALDELVAAQFRGDP